MCLLGSGNCPKVGKEDFNVNAFQFFRGSACAYLIALLIVTVGIPLACADPVDMGSKEYGTLSGFVYCDDNNNAIWDNNEFMIRDVLIILDGLLEPVDPNDPVAQMWGLGLRPLDPGEKETFQTFTWTNQYGLYRFENLLPGRYSVTEVTPYMFIEGKANAAGSLGGTVATGNQYTGVVLADGDDGVNYNFGEWGLRTKYLSKRELIVVVPEPSFAVFGIGLVLMGVFLRRRR